jgi:solute carrier family 12 (sodium/potassium/chloride transporter), member 2
VAQEQGADDDTRRYGTIEGVFVPTLLTILGVILFLRTGWVMGNAGLLGGVGIIVLAFLITGLTALSLASISTNVTPEAGGAYALVARSFGVEAGGAVGVPLYLSQSLVVVLYVFGFRDGWLAIFPGHPPLVIDIVMVAVLIGIVLISTKTAFRFQFLILGIVAVSLGSMAMAAFTEPWIHTPPTIGEFPGAPEDGFSGADVWIVFAVFFPATTGIMAGLNMSGELRDARRSILRGTLAAVAVSLVIYLAVAVWLAFAGTTSELVGNYFAMVDLSAWAPAVLAGLLAATFSSALASLVGAPRILQALAAHRVTPAASWLAGRDRRGEPRNALLVTITIVAMAVLLRDLNAIAPLITLVFLFTYGAINAAVLAETVVDLPSYRPTFRVHWIVPLLGAIGCVGAMFVINARLTLFALVAGNVVIVWLARRDLERPVTDIRSAMLVALAQWATRTARRTPSSDERTWSPRLLVPVRHDEDVERARRWLPELAVQGGPVRLVALGPEDIDESLGDEIARLREDLEKAGLDPSTTKVGAGEAERGPAVALLAAGDEEDPQAANVLLAGFPERPNQDAPTRLLLRQAFEMDVGVVLVPPQPPPLEQDERGAEERTPVIALWVRAQGPSWRVGSHLPHSDLALLLAYRLVGSLDAELAMVTAVHHRDDVEAAEDYLREVAETARMPGPPDIHVIQQPFAQALDHAPSASLHVLALSTQVDFDWLREVREHLDAPCLFVRDSGVENAFA